MKNRLKNKFNLNKKQSLAIFTLSIILLLSIFSITGIVNFASIYDAGSGEARYNELIIDNTGGSTLTDYPLTVTVPYNENMQADFNDVRFYDSDDNLIPHYKNSYTASTTAEFLVKNSITADEIQTIYMYSGNPDAVDVSDTSLFMHYDDFSTDTTATYTLTETSGTHTISYDSGNERLQYSTTSAGYSFVTKDITGTTNGFVMEMDATLAGTHTGYGAFFVDSTADTAEFVLCRHDAVSDLIRFDTFNSGWVYAGGTSIGLSSAAGQTHHIKNIYNSVDDVAKCYVDGSYYLSDTLVHTSGEVGFINYDGIAYFDNLKIRKYVADEPTVTIGALYNENGRIYNYFIEDDLDVTIPISPSGSGTETFYVKHEDGRTPNANLVYDYYDDCTSTDGWEGSTGYLSITDDGLKLHETTSSAYQLYKNLGGSYSDVIFEYKQKKHDVSHVQGSGVQLLPTNTITNRFTVDNCWYASGWLWRTYSAGAYTDIDTTGAFETWYISKHVVRNTDSQWDFYTYNADGSLKNSDTGNSWAIGSPTGSITYMVLSTPSIDWESTTYEWFRISKYTANEPSVVVTDLGSYYKVVVTNNEVTPLANYQFTIDGAELGITATDDSISITDYCPMTISEETVPSTVDSGNDAVLSVTLSDTITDAKATITLPDTSSELVLLSNTEGNTWTATLNYAPVGTYTIDNFKFNSETVTIDSVLTFDVIIALSDESLTETSFNNESTTTLTATFSNTITDAKATITLPDTSSELVLLSNTEGNVWTKELSYTELGNYTIENYKLNSESETIDSALTFEIVAVSETPTTPSSSGGGGGYSAPITTTEEETVETTEENIEIVENSDQSIDFGLFNTDSTTIILFVISIISIGLIVNLYREKK